MATPVKEQIIEGAINQWWSDSNSIRILITGKTGTGKSSLVNAILGKEVAPVGKQLNSQTSQLELFETQVEDVRVTVWDSPGLQDGSKDEEINCKDQVDLLLYCISMEDTRFFTGSRDIDSMMKLTEKLGKGVWDNAVLVLTCANKFISARKSMLPKSDDLNEKLKTAFTEQLDKWKTELKKCLRDTLQLPMESVEKIPILPAGRRQLPTLLSGMSPWLSNLRTESLLAAKRNAQPALVKMNLHRLKNSFDTHSEEEFAELLRKECIIINKKAEEIGKLLIDASGVAESVGRLSGRRKMIVDLVERILDKDPNITTITIGNTVWQLK